MPEKNGVTPKSSSSQDDIASALSQRFVRMNRRGIGARLLFFIILFSSLVTLIATAIQFYTDYQRDVNVIEQRLDEIEISYLESIQASLWNMDIIQIELQLEGIMRFPDVVAVELVETDDAISSPLVMSYGKRGEEDRAKITRTLSVMRIEGDKIDRQLGTLYIEATLTEVYGRLYERAVVILFSQGIKTFLVSLFILYLFHRLVTRHLEKFAAHAASIDFTQTISTLSLSRKEGKHDDELDEVVHAFNDMCTSLMNAYGDLSEANRELKNDNLARRKAEEEVLRLNSELEQRVFQRTSELEAANKELSSFCYSVSHDLRAPLRRIEGFRRILKENYADTFDDQSMHYLGRIQAGTHEMSEMIDSFLKLSRSTNTTLTLESVNLSRMVAKIHQRLGEKEQDRKININIESNLEIEGDRRLLDIMLTNLIENAWKYTQKIDGASVEFSSLNESGRHIYFVKDNGAGFDMAVSKHLFKPFTRLHNNSEFEGIGIGLATVQRIVARHGGCVWFDAEEGEGATFFFSLWDKEIE